MNKVLLATSLLLAITAFAARQFVREANSEARFDLYQRREWCPERVWTERLARSSERLSSR